MKLRLPLAGKLLLWLLLNLLLLAALVVLTSGQRGLGWQTLLSEPVRDRMFAIGQSLGRDLSAEARAQWPGVLAEYGERYGAHFDCCEESPAPRRGEAPPPDDRGAPFDDRPPPPRGDEQPPFGASFDRHDRPPPNQPGPPMAPPDDRGPAQRIVVRRLSGAGYAIGIPLMVGEGRDRHPASMTATVPTLWALARFLGLQHWLTLPLLGVVLSLLLWLPLMLYLTRSIARVTEATQRIADGRFDVRVALRSGDELGHLSEAVNGMAARLQRHADAQRLFLADVAHEVTSPLSRPQIGLGILEERSDDASRAVIADLQEDAEQMSDLLRELLLFSRADNEFAQRSQAESFALRPLLEAVIQRDGERVALHVDDGLALHSHRAFVIRAVSNLVRNAMRYAGDAGPIELRAQQQGEHVEIAVLDRGPGVPAAAIARLGDPFFRPEHSRSRDSGGFGLGLAIVRRCAQACGGSVSFRNRADGGFEALLSLPRQAPQAG